LIVKLRELRHDAARGKFLTKIHETCLTPEATRQYIPISCLVNRGCFFGLYQNLFAASVRSIALRLTAFLDQPTPAKKHSPKWKWLNQDTEVIWP